MKDEMKKVLIISYYWPPAGGISVLRSLKIAKYLTKNGWKPIVLTVGNPQYPILEEGNFKHIPEEVEILKSNAFQPFSIYKKLTRRKKNDTLANVLNANDKKTGLLHKLAVWIRANFFIPDARSSWIKPALKTANQYIKDHQVDAIFSDGPPHTNTLIACYLSEQHGLPWLMDWQDPWTEVDYFDLFPMSETARKKHLELEKRCINQSAAMTIVSPTWKKDVERLGAKNVEVVYWGYDEDDFKGLSKNTSDYFMISHVGLLGEDRVSESFFEALAELCTDHPSFKTCLKVVLIGTITNTVNELIKKHSLEEVFELKPQVEREQALQTVLDSDINLLLLNIAKNARGRIPGKLFEYIYANNSILNLGPLDCDVDLLLSDLAIGQTCTYQDKEGIKEFLISEYNNKNMTKPERDISKYSIQHYTKEISGILNKLNTKQ